MGLEEYNVFSWIQITLTFSLNKFHRYDFLQQYLTFSFKQLLMFTSLVVLLEFRLVGCLWAMNDSSLVFSFHTYPSIFVLTNIISVIRSVVNIYDRSPAPGLSNIHFSVDLTKSRWSVITSMCDWKLTAVVT